MIAALVATDLASKVVLADSAATLVDLAGGVAVLAAILAYTWILSHHARPLQTSTRSPESQ